jgi:hypothetical protein
MDPDPAFGSVFQNVNKNKLFFSKNFCFLLFEGTFTSVFKDKQSQNSRNQGFSYYFCLMIEGSGSEPGPYLSLTNPYPGDPNTYLWINNTGFWETIFQNFGLVFHKIYHKYKLKASVVDPDVYPGCVSRIPDPRSDFFFHPRSRIRMFSIPDPRSASKNLSILTPKNQKMVSKL